MKYSPLIFALLIGCAVGDDDNYDVEPVTDRAELSWTKGAVSIDYDVQSQQVDVHAHFLDATNLEPQAAFDALEIWKPDWELDLDVCTLKSELSQAKEPRLRLINVDEITVETAGEVHTLEQRRLPDVMSGVSGVIYGNTEGFEIEAIPVPYLPNETYVIQARGSDEASGFETILRAPNAAVVESINDVPRAFVTGVFESEGDVKLTWDGAEEGDVWLVFRNESNTLGQCRLSNDGSFSIPERLLPESGEALIELRTVRSSQIDIDGFGPAEIMLSTADTVTVRRR